jgi:peroxiredoxin
VGRALPDTALTDELGHPVALATFRGSPLVLVFFRGALCVACRAEVTKFAERAPPFIAEGVRIVGISADPPETSARWKQTERIPFPLLSDSRRTLTESICGQNGHCVVLVDSAGVVRWGALNDYWRGAPRPEVVLRAAARLGDRKAWPLWASRL